MRPDDPFGTPGTPIFRKMPSRSYGCRAPLRQLPTTHTYSLSIRPGETKTQVIELPGLTLELVISMPGLYPRAG